MEVASVIVVEVFRVISMVYLTRTLSLARKHAHTETPKPLAALSRHV